MADDNKLTTTGGHKPAQTTRYTMADIPIDYWKRVQELNHQQHEETYQQVTRVGHMVFGVAEQTHRTHQVALDTNEIVKKTREEIRRSGGSFGVVQSWLLMVVLVAVNIIVLSMAGLFSLVYVGITLVEVAILVILWKELNLFPESSRNRQNEGRR